MKDFSKVTFPMEELLKIPLREKEFFSKYAEQFKSPYSLEWKWSDEGLEGEELHRFNNAWDSHMLNARHKGDSLHITEWEAPCSLCIGFYKLFECGSGTDTTRYIEYWI